jgi:hypothetical protein
MKVLEAHRERTQGLKAAMEGMLSLHDDLYDTWNEIVAQVEGEQKDRVEKISDLHDRTKELAVQIGDLRRKTFGHLSSESALLLSSMVDSTSLLFHHEQEVEKQQQQQSHPEDDASPAAS